MTPYYPFGKGFTQYSLGMRQASHRPKAQSPKGMNGLRLWLYWSCHYSRPSSCISSWR
ncbi:protein of unknown function [Acidithiobacillus ferrivorans]|uniref:Uncharacterized protein n=1 Tax=Acidithiobacillus ferrivorans TaxID=160808 RepID=A0A060UUG8_9PROT|nr:hypothetical protein AFERRI_600182 [Acidithiobacillus ferrivorans]SMH65512.1 protein of unknown function [Acidithiobacillus ferrivorans]